MTSLNGIDTNYSSLSNYRLYLDPGFDEGRELLSNLKLSSTPLVEQKIVKEEKGQKITDYKSFLDFYNITFKKGVDVTIFIPKDISGLLSSMRQPTNYTNETSPVNIAKYHSLPFLLFTSQFKGRKIKVFTKLTNHYFYISYVSGQPYVFDEQSNAIKITDEGFIDTTTKYYVIEKDMKSVYV